MSREGAQEVFGTAIVDAAFCRALLDCPAKAVAGFDLTQEEFAALAGIRANSLMQFATKFERWRLSKAVCKEQLPGWHRQDAYALERLAG